MLLCWLASEACWMFWFMGFLLFVWLLSVGCLVVTKLFLKSVQQYTQYKVRWLNMHRNKFTMSQIHLVALSHYCVHASVWTYAVRRRHARGTLGIGCIRLKDDRIRWHTLAYADIRQGRSYFLTCLKMCVLVRWTRESCARGTLLIGQVRLAIRRWLATHDAIHGLNTVSIQFFIFKGTLMVWKLV